MKRNKWLYGAAALLLSGGLLFTSCSDDDEKIPTPPEQNKPDKGDGNKRKTTDEQYYANNFAHDILSVYYYWNEQIAGDLKKLDPNTNTDPIKTVSEIKYHEGKTQVDRWTMLTDDMEQFQSGVAGVSTTYGYQPFVYRMKGTDNLLAAVAFIYKGSPAEKAGIKRGDLIYGINGKPLTENNYLELFNSSSITLSFAEVKHSATGNVINPTEKEIKLTAVKMYEDPVLKDSVYDCNGKKVGYLAYSSFDLNSIPKLIEVSKKFKAQGVKELILDLRYNGGGYVITENAMASMYAPEEAVRMREVFEIEKYNKILTKENEKEEGFTGETRFSTEHEVPVGDGKRISYSTEDANIGIDKVYGLISGNSASASEALLSGLMPYMDVELIGSPSHGKYCTGIMLDTPTFYNKIRKTNVPKSIENWGIYVMIAIYQNAKGETPCMPNGLQPNISAEEDMLFQTQLGDVNEDLLKVALQRAGKVYDDKEVKSRTSLNMNMKALGIPHKANFGKRILLSGQLPSLNK